MTPRLSVIHKPTRILPKLEAHKPMDVRDRLGKSIDLRTLVPLAVPAEPMFFDTQDRPISRTEFEEWFTCTLDIRRATAIPGFQVIRVQAIFARDWGATQLVQIVDANGGAEGIAVARWWPDAPGLDPFPPDCFATRWKDRAVHGWTDANGHVGFGMGSGDCPPGHSGVFPIHCQAPADYVGNLGWAPGDAHKTAFVVFALTDEDDPPPPPPPPDPDQRFALLADYFEAVGKMSTSLGEQLREES